MYSRVQSTRTNPEPLNEIQNKTKHVFVLLLLINGTTHSDRRDGHTTGMRDPNIPRTLEVQLNIFRLQLVTFTMFRQAGREMRDTIDELIRHVQ